MLLVEAALRLAQVSIVLALLPFRRAVRCGSVQADGSPGDFAECCWAIEAAACRAPWRTVCIHKGLALQRMLRRRGFDATLHYGIGKDPAELDLKAHVWVTLDGEPLIGGREAEHFIEVASYP